MSQGANRVCRFEWQVAGLRRYCVGINPPHDQHTFLLTNADLKAIAGVLAELPSQQRGSTPVGATPAGAREPESVGSARRPGDAGALIEALVDESRCGRCDGQARVYRRCSDRQCGDSTWDHECDEGYDPCRDCAGTGKGPAGREALAWMSQQPESTPEGATLIAETLRGVPRRCNKCGVQAGSREATWPCNRGLLLDHDYEPDYERMAEAVLASLASGSDAGAWSQAAAMTRRMVDRVYTSRSDNYLSREEAYAVRVLEMLAVEFDKLAPEVNAPAPSEARATGADAEPLGGA
jgi:hypothetical protein